MTGHESIASIHDLIDGLLPPDEERLLRARIAADPQWAERYRRAAALHVLLGESLDVAPPPDLAASVLKSVTTDRVRRTFRLPIPSSLEKGLVLAGVGALAALVIVGPPALQSGAGGWLGRLVVAGANGLTAAVEALVAGVGGMTHWDWVIRLAATLSDAARTVLASSAGTLLVVWLGAVLLAATAAGLLMRSEKGIRGGGLGHAHLAW
jgi:anti-sigma factor RsiW